MRLQAFEPNFRATDLEWASGVKFHSHLLRHKMISELAYDPAVPLAVAVRVANHKDPRTTMSYVDDREEAMASALEGR